MRLYSHIPLVAEEDGEILSSNAMEPSDATCGHIFPIVSVLKHYHMTYYLEQFNDAMRDRVLQRFEQVQQDASTPCDLDALRASIKESYAKRALPVPVAGAITTMPAHPSLALLFLKKDYRKIPDRSVVLSIDGFEPILCEVDRERTVYIPLTRADGTAYDALLVNGIKNGRKVIDVKSTVSVENATPLTLSVAFVNGKQEAEKSEYTLKHRMSESCPLKWCNDTHVVVRCAGREGAGVMKVEDIKGETLPRCLNIGTEERPLFVRVVVHKDTVYDVYNKQSVDAFHVTLAPVMKIMNLLPMPMEYCVCDGAARTAPATIEEGEETRCYDVALTGAEETARVCIKPEGCAEFTAAEASILPAASEKRESVEIVDASGRTVRLSYKAIADLNGTINIQVYCDFWLLNRTGEEIFVQEKGSRAEPLALPAVACPIVKLSSFQFKAEERIAPVLFSYADPDSRSRAMLLRSAHSKWCNDGVTIDALGSSTRFCLPDKKDSEQDGKKRIFGVNVVQAPSMFANTYVVTITPGMFVSNHTDYELALRLGTKETDPVTRLGARETIAYHCPAVVDKVQFCVQIDALATEWTAPFDAVVEEQNELLAFKGEAEEDKVLRMRGAMNGAQREVVFDFADAFNTFLYKKQLEKKKTFLNLGKKEEIQIASLLEDCQEKDEEKEGKESVRVNVNFGGVGLSLVDQKPQEIMYICVDDFKCEFILCDDGKIALGATLMKCQIDSGVPGSKYPVFFGSTEAGEPNPEYDEANPPGRAAVQAVLPAVAVDAVEPVDPVPGVPGSVPAADDVRGGLGHAGGAAGYSERAVHPRGGRAAGEGPRGVGEEHDVHDEQHGGGHRGQVVHPGGQLHHAAHHRQVQLPQRPLRATLRVALPAEPRADARVLRAEHHREPGGQPGQRDDQPALAAADQLLHRPHGLRPQGRQVLRHGGHEQVLPPRRLLQRHRQPHRARRQRRRRREGLLHGARAGPDEGPRRLRGRSGQGHHAAAEQDHVRAAELGEQDHGRRGRRRGGDGDERLVPGGPRGGQVEPGARRVERRDGRVHGDEPGLQGQGRAGRGDGPGQGRDRRGREDGDGRDRLGDARGEHGEGRGAQGEEAEPMRSPRYIPLDNVLESYNAHLSDGIALLQVANSGSGIRLEPKERYVVHCAVDNGSSCLILTTRHFVLVTPRGKLLGVAAFDELEFKRAGQELEVIPTRAKSQKQLVRAVDSAVNQLTSHVDGELRLKPCSLLIESEKLCGEIEHYCLNVENMTMDDVAEVVRRMLRDPRRGERRARGGGREEAQRAGAGGAGAEEPPLREQEARDGEERPDSEGGDALQGGGDERRRAAAVWYVYIRYNDLE